jgi:type I restriction enzyme M protein
VSPRQLVQKLWSYCQVLRDDGVSTLDYVQQFAFLLFLKMADEQTKAPWNKPSPVPAGLDWPSLLEKSGDELEAHYEVFSVVSAFEGGQDESGGGDVADSLGA